MPFYTPIFLISTSEHKVDWASMSSMFPLSFGYRARRRGALKAETQAEHSMEHESDSGLVWTLLGLKGWYTGLLIRLFHVSTERLRLTSYAVFLTRSSDRSSSLFGFSIWIRPLDTVRQPAEETVAASGRLPTSRHVLSEGSKRHRALKIHDGLEDNVETV